jgi:Domain of unknown function (DUF4114)
MRSNRLVLLCCLAVLAVLPAQVFADSFCGNPAPYQYQECGTVAAANTFTVNSNGLITGVTMFFGGYHADFSSSINALVWRNGELVYTGADTPTNQSLTLYQRFQLVPSAELQAGDQIEFVLHVNDPNGEHDFYSAQLNKNMDGLNHVWAQTLTNGQCMLFAGPCAYLGFEDLPPSEQGDFDYNDFMAFVVGLDVQTGNNPASPVPEPSPILLLTGAPLAFVVSKLRRLL